MKVRRELDDDCYSRNYRSLKDALGELKEKRATLSEHQLAESNQKTKLQKIQEALQSHKTPLEKFDEALFTALVEKIIIHSPTELTFVLFGGTQYHIDGAKYKPLDTRGRPRKKQ